MCVCCCCFVIHYNHSLGSEMISVFCASHGFHLHSHNEGKSLHINISRVSREENKALILAMEIG